MVIIKMDIDLLHPTPEDQKRQHKKKRLVQSPNSYFMDIRCPACYTLTTAFSHAQTVIKCENCSQVLAQPKGGKCKLVVGCSVRVKSD
jgi:small subunit ribosomal protein S27e